MRKVLRNSIRTPDGTVLHSRYRHDFQIHTDKNGEVYMTDGGNDMYFRRSVNTIPYEDLTVYDDGKHETRRAVMEWGKNYDKEGNRLPETQYVLIKDLDIDHIYAILQTQIGISPLYRSVLEDEIISREKEILESYGLS